MDVLSDVLRVVRLTGSIFFVGDFSAPWAVASSTPDKVRERLMPAAEMVSPFHVLFEGSCWLTIGHAAPLRVQAGDLLIFPHGHQHRLASDTRLTPVPMASILPSPAAHGFQRMAHGGGGAPTRFVCGFVACDQRFNPLLAALPPLLHVRCGAGPVSIQALGDDVAAPPVRLPDDTGPWLESAVRYLVQEAGAPRDGSSTTQARLVELIFIEVLRHYVGQATEASSGWLAGLRDPVVGRVLALLHAEPARAWTVDELGRRVGVSRSVLAERFTEVVGEAPMHYLATWRMHLARQLLREDRLSVPEIAARAGYESESAFNRAFKRIVGIPPAAWRRRERPALASRATAPGSSARARVS